MALMDFLFGSKDKFSQQPTYNPQQQQALSQILSQLGMMGGQGGAYSGAQNYLQSLLSGDENAFANFEAPYLNQFNEQTLPGIAERFAGGNAMGGALSSSGFGQALGGAGAQLQAQLAGLRSNLQQGAAQSALGQYNQLAGLGLGARPFENTYQPGSTGLLGGLGSGLAAGAGMGFGMPLGMGSFTGLGSLIKGIFGGGMGQGSPAAGAPASGGRF